MSRKHTRVVVFDLDGTLVDTLPDLAVALNASLEAEGMDTVSAESARKCVGLGARAMIENALCAQGQAAEHERVARMHAAFLEHYSANIARHSRPFDGVEAALDTLAESGFTLAVCTNKYEKLARDLLRELDLAHRFAAIAGGDSFGVSKPDPAHLTQTVAAAGGGSAVMVGDSAPDITAARRAAIPSVAVSFGYPPVPVHELGADRIIDHYRELHDNVLDLLADQPDAPGHHRRA